MAAKYISFLILLILKQILWSSSIRDFPGTGQTDTFLNINTYYKKGEKYMKKLFSIILCAVMLLSASVPVFARYMKDDNLAYGYEYDETYKLGDANGDGEVNLMDITLMLKYIAKWDVVLG